MFKLIIRILKKIFCKHDGRIISFYPDTENTSWRNGKHSGKHPGIIFKGCLKCRKVWIEDYME